MQEGKGRNRFQLGCFDSDLGKREQCGGLRRCCRYSVELFNFEYILKLIGVVDVLDRVYKKKK